jgi:mannose-6-phosphate isomerase-like protein (cupin superfamily)
MEEGISRARLDPDADARFVTLRRDLGVSSFGLNQMVLQPGERGRIHRHGTQEEVYLVLEGLLTVTVEGEGDIDLHEGELLRVAPRLRRQLVNRSRNRVMLVALGGSNEHRGRDAEAFASWEAEAGASPAEVPLPPDLDPSELRY